MKTIKAVFSCLLICAALAGCSVRGDSQVPDTDEGKTPDTDCGRVLDISQVNAGALLEPKPRDDISAAVAKGANDFAFKLSAALSKQNGGENFVCSPYSAWLSLAALVNASDEQSKAGLLTALGAEGVSEADINRAASRMLYDLTKQKNIKTAMYYGDEYYHNPLNIVNSIFVRSGMTLKKDFAQTFADYYRGDIIGVDFSSENAADAVNKWAGENTGGLITEIINDFDSGTIAAIANAVYFSDRWEWEFDPGKTTENVFHSPAGDTKAFYMLRKGDDLTYYEDDRVQAMPLNFKTGGGLYVILPKDGDAEGLLSSMTGEYFDAIQRDSLSATGKLLMPRFTIESGLTDLKSALTDLGIPLFDEAAAPLTGGLTEEEIPVWLSGAVQKAVIKVDEKGTTAAAVTVMPLYGAALPQPTDPFEMNCNKPFVFVLYGSTYDGGNQIIFTGVVNRP